MSDILDGLNKEQIEAVKQTEGAVLILAGAGSGKTKTLTTRLAYLIDCVGIAPSDTLTLTFTNKAAAEMRERALNLISTTYTTPPLLCTFHRFGLLFLRKYIGELGRKADFVLIDSDDKKRILKGFQSTLPPSTINNAISTFKNSIISPQIALESANDKQTREIANIYLAYNKFLFEKNMLDFDDLLLLTYEILCRNDGLCSEISKKYQYIMVDEYQDTNELQYKLLERLCKEHNNICVVGDDDQSIYGWRGADINNILDFSKHFSGAKIIKLESNYRSTTQILEAANRLISHNTKRLGKTLRSTKGDGEGICVINSRDEREEIFTITKKIQKLLSSGVSPREIAILFRLNALSRSVEDGLSRAGIPYKLIGAMRFYERAEIKDILSYFRLIINFDDDFSLTRIINKPRRGIGKVTIDKLESLAAARNTSIYGLFTQHLDSLDISKKNIEAILAFFTTLKDLRAKLNDGTLKFLESFKDEIKILESYPNDDIDREANIDEFYGFFKDYIIQNPEASLEDFLNDISLSSDSDDDVGECVSCMSIHSAKGLEFEHVFIVGCESGFFPLMSDTNDIQEERRLGYVAFTRAKSHLSVSCVNNRLYRGKRTMLNKSIFLEEAGLIENKANFSVESSDEFSKNDLVEHKIFGVGRVVSVSKIGSEVKLEINFGGVVKNIISTFVKRI